MTLARIDDLGDRLVVVNMNKTKRGALTPDLVSCACEAIGAASDPRIRAVLLTSEGGFFCAGGDLTVLKTRQALSEVERRDQIDKLHDLIRAIRASPVPVVAAVEGGAAGAGLSLALACDFIVAAQDALFTASYVKAGLVPDGGLTTAFAQALPRQLAMDICLLAEPVTADRFQALGVISRLVPPGSAHAEAIALIDRIARGPGAAQREIRHLVASAYDCGEAAQLDAERDAMARAQGGTEAAEGIAAFLEKRSPNYN